MKKRQAKYKIIGCDHRFVPTTNTYKECDTCELTRENKECLCDIATGERYYVFLKYFED